MPVLRRRARRAHDRSSKATTISPTKRLGPPSARGVLLATDGSETAGAAIRFASIMADAGLWRPQAVTVVEHLPVAVADMALPRPTMMVDPAIDGGYLETIRRQLSRMGGKDWNLRVELGGAARSIAALARTDKAELIVLGLGKHGKLARLLGAETVSRVCRLADVPVLAVDASARLRPRTALVAMDFGDSSVRAAREALALLQPNGRLHLLHVQSMLDGSIRDPGWDRMYAAGVEHGFDRLRMDLAAPSGIEITSEFRRARVLETILKVSEKIGADVVAVGSHSQTVIDRLIIGSTTSQLLRAVHCSMLVAPPEGTSRSA